MKTAGSFLILAVWGFAAWVGVPDTNRAEAATSQVPALATVVETIGFVYGSLPVVIQVSRDSLTSASIWVPAQPSVSVAAVDSGKLPDPVGDTAARSADKVAALLAQASGAAQLVGGAARTSVAGSSLSKEGDGSLVFTLNYN